MNHHGHWRLAITPLSPIHLGTGQDYEPTGYVIEDGALHAFDALTALAALPANERDRLGQMLAGDPTQATLRQVQRFFYDNRQALIAAAGHQVQVNPSVEAFYRERVGQVVQHESGGQKVQNRLEIERTAYNPPTGQAILPGSGLKGAIRTALLNAVNKGDPLPPDLTRDRQKNQRLQERLFDYRMGKLENDPLRLVSLGDAHLRDPQAFATQVRFAVNRKKDAVFKGGAELDSQAERQGLYQLLECLPPLMPRTFDGSLTLRDTGGIESPKWPSRRFTFAEIALACNQFYRPLLAAELKLLRSRGFLDHDWADALQQVLDGPVGQALASNRAWLLRVGRHSGAESVTLAGLRNIRIMRGPREQPDWLDHAKTLWLASDERLAKRQLLPFGWLLVEPWQAEQDLSAWPTLDYDSGIPAWKQRIQDRQAQVAADQAAIRQREQERAQADAEATRAEAERQARLAAMSAEEQAIDAIRALPGARSCRRAQGGGGRTGGCPDASPQTGPDRLERPGLHPTGRPGGGGLWFHRLARQQEETGAQGPDPGRPGARLMGGTGESDSNIGSILLCTVGGSHTPILTAIAQARPDYVVFFASGPDPATGQAGSLPQVLGKGAPVTERQPDGQDRKLANIPTLAGLGTGAYEAQEVPTDDLDGAVGLMRQALRDLRRDHPQARIVADYTGGTKSMAAALVLVALESEGVELQLVTGARGDLIRVQDGSQARIAVETEGIRLRRALDAYLGAWESFNYAEAAAGLERLGRLQQPRDRFLRGDLQIARDLSRAFDAWDRFDHASALPILDNYRARIGRHSGLLFTFLDLLLAHDARQRPARLWDLWLNAQRKGAQARYDDAVARLYRLTEGTAQWLLARRGIDTAALAPEHLPPDSDLRPTRDGTFKAGLLDAWRLAAHHLGGEVAGFFAQQGEPLRHHLLVRNASLLAHGDQPIGAADWQGFNAWAERHLLPLIVREAQADGFRLQPPQLPRQPLW